jgi:LuxR family maltose regulon positive regulatory protein
MLIATGLYAKGLLRAAEIHYRDTIRKSIEEKYPIVLSASICGLGRTLMKQGRLRIAHNAIIAAISELKKQGIYHRLQGRSGLNLVLGEIAYKQNRLDKALEYLQQAKMESRQILVSDQYEEISRTVDVLHAVILWQQGSDTDAENTLLEISDLSVKPNRLPLFPPLSLYVARWLLLMGKSKQADNWVKEKKISIDDEVDASREDECLLLIQLLQYRQEYDQVVSLTSKLLPDAEQESRIDTILELLVQQAMALSRLNKREQAIECMHRALDMAEANGYVRIFLDEKEPVLSLLRDIVHSGKNSQYALNLLDQAALGHGDAAVYPVATNGSNTGLLSAAELNLLRLLAKGLTNKEIASQLNISNNTVKTHLKNIYTKLGVNSRAKAILIASVAGFSLE